MKGFVLDTALDTLSLSKVDLYFEVNSLVVYFIRLIRNFDMKMLMVQNLYELLQKMTFESNVKIRFQYSQQE